MAAAHAKPQLYYFNGRGRAECTRILLTEAGMEFEDKRIEGKDWPALKPTAPYGQMPFLKVGGHTIAQSAAMERWAARAAKMYGANDLQAAQVDMVCEGVNDAMAKFSPALFNKDENEKKTLLAAYFKDEFPKWGTALTGLLKSNAGSGYFVGADATLADVRCYVAFDMIRNVNAEAFKAFPELSALLDRVAARPKVAAWIKARPVTPF